MALAGYNTTVKLGSNLIAGINNVTFDAALDQLDTSAFNVGVRSFIPGLSGATITVSGDYDPTDTNGQVALVNAWSNKTLLTTTTAPEFLVNGTNGFSADAYVSAFNVGSAVEGKATVSFTLQLTGTITVS
jgi:hypothetical protein